MCRLIIVLLSALIGGVIVSGVTYLLRFNTTAFYAPHHLFIMMGLIGAIIGTLLALMSDRFAKSELLMEALTIFSWLG